MSTIVLDDFTEWLDGVRDRAAVARIRTRIIRLEQGNPGDVRPIGKGASELRVDHGPGYRVYYLAEGDAIYLLYGGTKKTQSKDIAYALSLIEE